MGITRVLLAVCVSSLIVLGCTSDEPALIDEDAIEPTVIVSETVAAPAEVVAAEPIVIDALFSVNGRMVAANLGEAPQGDTIEIVTEESGRARVAKAVQGLGDLAEQSTQDVDLDQSMLIVAYDDLCRSPAPAVLEIDGDLVTVVHREVGFGCTATNFHYTVFELPHSFGFGPDNPPEVTARADGL